MRSTTRRSGSRNIALLVGGIAGIGMMGLGIGCQKTETAATPPPAAAPTPPPAPAAPAAKPPLRIAYSDWPGWTAFEIAIQKGWFKEAGVDVKFDWFEYAPSMEAFAAGKVDAVMVTVGDALVTGAPGARSVGIIATDYSNGNDMIVARPGIKDLKGLKGKKVGLEIGLVEHLLLLKGLEKAGLKETDVKLVNVPTHQTAQTLASKDVDAIGAWQPNAGQALKAVAHSKAILTSADLPGLIYDLVSVSPKSLSTRRDDWIKVVKVWNRTVAFVTDPANQAEAVKIMAGRAGVPAEDYAKFLPGTRFLSPQEALARFDKKEGLETLYGSGLVADAFNVANKVYPKAQPVAEYLDGSLLREALGARPKPPLNNMAAGRRDWLRPFGELLPRRRLTLGTLAFLLPLGLWCLVSYVPFIWHPMIKVTDPGDVDWMTLDQVVEGDAFRTENQAVAARGGHVAHGTPENPVFLPAPHQVLRALVTGFTTPPARPDEPWLHEALLHSIGIIFWGFLISSLIGVPLGILCGALPSLARLTEPFIEFFRYLPAPAFGALAVAVMGINDAPKIAIIFIGTFFQQVLIISNTTRRLDPALLEAAQTLGAKPRQLLWRVVVPGIVTDLYGDQRVLLGWAWTYLIVAELIGVSSGITFFINQQAKYRAYDRVFASIILIGLIGLFTDVILASIGRQIFPWVRTARAGWLSQAMQMFRRTERRIPATPISAPVTDEPTTTVSAGEVAS